MPTFIDSADKNINRNIGIWEGGTYNADEASYLADLKTGWDSGKYSYEDLQTSYDILGKQYKPPVATPTHPQPPLLHRKKEVVGMNGVADTRTAM